MHKLAHMIIFPGILFCILGCVTGPIQNIDSINSKGSSANRHKALGSSCGNSQEGLVRQGYISNVATVNEPCPMGIQTCLSGQWIGPNLFETCEDSGKSCGGFFHGSSVSGYQLATSPKGIPCVPLIKTCINGTWIGPEVFPSCTELP